MTTKAQTMMDRLEEGLATLWFQMDRVGNSRLQNEIEDVSDQFPVQEGSSEGRWVADAAHHLFRRVNAEYPGETLGRFGLEPVECPHCAPPERGE